MPDKNFNGGCQCGAVRYQAKGEPIMAAICHCSMCRRANAAPVVAWAMFEDSPVTFTTSRPRNFASSQGADRGFCGTCGTSNSLVRKSVLSGQRVSGRLNSGGAPTIKKKQR